MTEFLKRLITDVVLRLIYITTGRTQGMKLRYRFMYFTRWEAKSNIPSDPDFFAHCRRAYLREPKWHAHWSLRK